MDDVALLLHRTADGDEPSAQNFTTGPAVFYRLEELTAGDEVLVGRSDGTTVRFTVTGIARYPKSDFGTAEVYGPTPDAQLRLITCGVDFDRSRRSYTDNVVVFARLAP